MTSVRPAFVRACARLLQPQVLGVSCADPNRLPRVERGSVPDDFEQPDCLQQQYCSNKVQQTGSGSSTYTLACDCFSPMPWVAPTPKMTACREQIMSCWSRGWMCVARCAMPLSVLVSKRRFLKLRTHFRRRNRNVARVGRHCTMALATLV